MLETISAGLGFVSASLVALIALGFGLMFVFFSGSATLILGHFLRFITDWKSFAIAVGLAAALVFGIALYLDAPQPWTWPVAQFVLSFIAWLFVCWKSSHRILRWCIGAGFLVSGVLFAVGTFVPAWGPRGLGAIAFAAAFLGSAAFGLWPLVLGGLVRHRQMRPVEWYISLRYLVARRRQTFISIISVICVVGVALGVSVITVVLSVMNGFSQMWEEKIIGARAHITVLSRLGEFPDYQEIRAAIAEVPGITGATPFVTTQAILRGSSGDIQAVSLQGIDPSTVGDATQLVEQMVEGSLEDLTARPDAMGTDALPGLVIGFELANSFFLRVGDPVVLISPLGGRPTPLGPAPRMERFRVSGVFRSDFYQFDESLVYTSLGAAQHFMKLDDVVTGVQARTGDALSSRALAMDVQQRLGGLYYARDWKDHFPGFFQALKTERTMMFVLLSFIMVVAGFIIIATLIMMIMEKSRDIAILKTMGADNDGILRIFAIEGFIIGVGGLVLGIGMGLVITWNLDVIQSIVERTIGFDVLPANVYQLKTLPYDIAPDQLALIALIAMVLSIGATLFPSWQAARLDPAEALRYE